MCEQDYENKKLVIAKFSFFLQARNSNFRLSANRAYTSDSWNKVVCEDQNRNKTKNWTPRRTSCRIHEARLDHHVTRKRIRSR